MLQVAGLVLIGDVVNDLLAHLQSAPNILLQNLVQTALHVGLHAEPTTSLSLYAYPNCLN